MIRTIDEGVATGGEPRRPDFTFVNGAVFIGALTLAFALIGRRLGTAAEAP